MILLRFRRHDLALVAGSIHRWSAARNPYTERFPTHQIDPACHLPLVGQAHSDPVCHRPLLELREFDNVATVPRAEPIDCPSIQVRPQRGVIWSSSGSRLFLLPCSTFSFNKPRLLALYAIRSRCGDQSILIFRRNCWFSLQTNSIGSSSTVTR